VATIGHVPGKSAFNAADRQQSRRFIIVPRGLRHRVHQLVAALLPLLLRLVVERGAWHAVEHCSDSVTQRALFASLGLSPAAVANDGDEQ
jgi:hypothetical protein